ncbi:MAG: (2Fe-2S)-binding protein, partial [Clostridia bacterium]|nr:(2Fe-2S)-binding protein [Clostridia bacterium]
MINLTINGIPVEAAEGTTILKAAASAGIEIPTLCYLEEVNDIGSCRLCIVDVEGMEQMPPACRTTVTEGMVVNTESPEVRAARKLILNLLLSNHHQECFSCPHNGRCDLQRYCNEYGVEKSTFEGTRSGIASEVRDSNPFLSYNS